MMVWDGHNWGWGGWLLMTFGTVVFWGLVIGTLVALLRGVSSRGPGAPAAGPGAPPAARSAEEILAERYARGEIDDEEYRHRLDVLRGRHGPTGLTKVG
jgi:putative membrane protein